MIQEETILEVLGQIDISNTQCLRVLKVKDAGHSVKVSVQKWWRKSVQEEWKKGKGFYLTPEHAVKLGRILLVADVTR